MSERDSKQLKSGLTADYDASSNGYETYWGPVLARLSQKFVKDISMSDAKAILDIGAGTGTMLRHLGERTKATLVGVDRSLGMLALAPAEAQRAVMDAERLAFEDDTFDVALAMFILFHLPSPARGLAEICRVLRHGGTVAFTTWGDDDPDFRAFDVFDDVLDRHGAAEGRGLYARFELSDTPEKCAALLEESGFRVSAIRSQRMAHQWTVEHLIGYRTQVGYGRVRWESLDASARAAVLEEGTEALAKLTPEDMVLRDEVIYTVGRVVV